MAASAPVLSWQGARQKQGGVADYCLCFDLQDDEYNGVNERINMDNRRKFANRLKGPGTAASIRESVLRDLKETSVLTKAKLIEPLDYENVIVKNKTLLQNDPQREMLLFPHDDVTQSELPRRFRTLQCSVPPNAQKEASQLLVGESLRAYTSKWHVIHFKYNAYSGSYDQLVLREQNQKWPEQKFEVDIELEVKEDESALRSRNITVVKKGWLLKGPDSQQDASIVSFNRSFKRRYVHLKQQADASYVLEFHKDEKRPEVKVSIFLDSAIAVLKSSKKGKLIFEIQMQEKRCHLLAAETETDLEEWVSVLKRVLESEGLENSLDRGRDRGSLTIDYITEDKERSCDS